MVYAMLHWEKDLGSNSNTGALGKRIVKKLKLYPSHINSGFKTYIKINISNKKAQYISPSTI